ncbi:hypothetical protein [Aeromicrobium sp. P5_D10]
MTAGRLRFPKVRGGMVGASAAACAVCCAAPVLGLVGIGVTGASATAAALALSGIVFALVVVAATIGAAILRRSQQHRRRHRLTVLAGGPATIDLLPTRTNDV